MTEIERCPENYTIDRRNAYDIKVEGPHHWQFYDSFPMHIDAWTIDGNQVQRRYYCVFCRTWDRRMECQ